MHIANLSIYLLPLLSYTTQTFAGTRIPAPKPIKRGLEALLLDPPSSLPTSPAPSPFLKHLDLRQVAAPAAQPAAAQPAANQNAAPATNQQTTNQNAAAPATNQQTTNQNAGTTNQNAGTANQPANAAAPAANAPANAAPAPVVAPAPAAPAAPAAGVGGAGAAPAGAQPGANAQANSVTTIQVQTVIGGVTTTVNQLYTQKFGDAAMSIPVKSGAIGMGTLTGKVGVLKTQDAKSEGLAVAGFRGRKGMVGEVGVVVFAGCMALVGGVLGIARI